MMMMSHCVFPVDPPSTASPCFHSKGTFLLEMISILLFYNQLNSNLIPQIFRRFMLMGCYKMKTLKTPSDIFRLIIESDKGKKNSSPRQKNC